MKRATFKLGPRYEFLPITFDSDEWAQRALADADADGERAVFRPPGPWLKGYLEASGFVPGDVVEITDGGKVRP